MQSRGYDISAVQEVVPRLQHLLGVFREAGFAVYHTREGHRPDLSTLTFKNHYQARHRQDGLEVGNEGPLGRFLVREQAGHDFIDELYPAPSECVVDKPAKSAFAHTDFELILRNQGIRNLVFVGYSTEFAVSTTMAEASDRGFDCLLLEDGLASIDLNSSIPTVDVVKVHGASVGSMSTIDDLCSAVEAFKSVTAKKAQMPPEMSQEHPLDALA